MPKRGEESNKSTFGRVLNIAGSNNFIGAACLSSKAALKVGAGYVSLASIDKVVDSVASMLPEITYISLKEKNGVIAEFNDIINLNSYDVISIGCGITNTIETRKFVSNILNKIKPTQKIILDADGINILGTLKEYPELNNVIITPHPRELSRLIGIEVDKIQGNREKYAVQTSLKYGCIIVLKGHNSVITDGNEVYINTTGTSALAKAGTGDVLTGIIAGLAAQKVSNINAAILGVFLHGLSGDIASLELTKYSVLASDVINFLPYAIKKII